MNKLIRVREILDSFCNEGFARSWRRTRWWAELRYHWAEYKVDSDLFDMANENLSSRSYLYFHCPSPESIKLVMEKLCELTKDKPKSQPRVCLNGGPNKNAHIEMQVSNFKGLNWWL
jgi:hypothetical protein